MPRTERAGHRPPDRGSSRPEAGRELARHLDACGACRDGARRGASAPGTSWARTPAPRRRPSSGAAARALIEEEMLRARVREFRPRPRLGSLRRARPRPSSRPPASADLAANRRPDTRRSGAAPSGRRRLPPLAELGDNSRLSNLSYRPTAAERPHRHRVRRDDPPHGRGLPGRSRGGHACSPTSCRATARTPARSRARSSSSRSTTARAERRASPDIVAALTATLQKDPNPGVRKKAADALAGMRDDAGDPRGLPRRAARRPESRPCGSSRSKRLAAAAKEDARRAHDPVAAREGGRSRRERLRARQGGLRAEDDGVLTVRSETPSPQRRLLR